MPAIVESDALHVLDGVEMRGTINTPDAELLANIQHSIRLGYPQVKPQGVQRDRVCLVGGGPSLEDTFTELRDLYFAGAKVVTVNGAYQWCLERNIRPSMQIVLDARAENARFVNPSVPQCRYLIASQCHPETWAQVKGRSDVWIWHAAAEDNEQVKPILDAYYAKHWTGTPGGTTVIVRALVLLRIIGIVRMDLFGVDSCFLHGQHHAYQQAENDVDKPHPVTLSAPGKPDTARVFQCTGWHVQQLICWLSTIRLHGDMFILNVHGDGMIAYAMKIAADAADVQIEKGDHVGVA